MKNKNQEYVVRTDVPVNPYFIMSIDILRLKEEIISATIKLHEALKKHFRNSLPLFITSASCYTSSVSYSEKRILYYENSVLCYRIPVTFHENAAGYSRTSVVCSRTSVTCYTTSVLYCKTSVVCHRTSVSYYKTSVTCYRLANFIQEAMKSIDLQSILLEEQFSII